jgi:hypothetical protein
MTHTTKCTSNAVEIKKPLETIKSPKFCYIKISKKKQKEKYLLSLVPILL